MPEALSDSVQWMIVGQVLTAALLGALIGVERQVAHKPAGVRTHMLVGAASCLLVALMPLLVKRFGAEGAGSAIRIDPSRLVQTVITGIAVLGAGSIIVHRDSHRVEGLTTAASVMLASAIGVAIAVHAWVVGVVLAVVTAIGLPMIRKLENRRSPDPK